MVLSGPCNLFPSVLTATSMTKSIMSPIGRAALLTLLLVPLMTLFLPLPAVAAAETSYNIVAALHSEKLLWVDKNKAQQIFIDF